VKRGNVDRERRVCTALATTDKQVIVPQLRMSDASRHILWPSGRVYGVQWGPCSSYSECPVDVLSSLCVRQAAARYSNFPLPKKRRAAAKKKTVAQ
jgi:hypothetical protein